MCSPHLRCAATSFADPNAAASTESRLSSSVSRTSMSSRTCPGKAQGYSKQTDPHRKAGAAAALLSGLLDGHNLRRILRNREQFILADCDGPVFTLQSDRSWLQDCTAAGGASTPYLARDGVVDVGLLLPQPHSRHGFCGTCSRRSKINQGRHEGRTPSQCIWCLKHFVPTYRIAHAKQLTAAPVPRAALSMASATSAAASAGSFLLRL